MTTAITTYSSTPPSTRVNYFAITTEIDPLGSQGTPRDPKGPHGTPWSKTGAEPHGIPKDPTGPHGNPNNYLESPNKPGANMI